MNKAKPNHEQTAQELIRERFPDAKAAFLAGSVVRGEHTPASDLDIVVVYDHIENAYRDSINYHEWPVELFVHDPETLAYFFYQMDRPSGCPSLPQMVNEGIDLLQSSEFSSRMKAMAKEVLDLGPIPWTDEDFRRARYSVTDCLDDIRHARSIVESNATGSVLFELLANFRFRSAGKWSAKGKMIPRKLKHLDLEYFDRFSGAFDELFRSGSADKVIALTVDTLRPFGGLLFEGYKLEAPSKWRQPITTKSSDSSTKSSVPEGLHHVEMYVSDLEASVHFWEWLLLQLGYSLFQTWGEAFTGGRSYKKNGTYLVFVQAEKQFLDPPYHRKRVGLNHLAFHAESQEQINSITDGLKQKGISLLYQDRNEQSHEPRKAVFFEDPDRIKVELVCEVWK